MELSGNKVSREGIIRGSQYKGWRGESNQHRLMHMKHIKHESFQASESYLKHGAILGR